MIKFNLMRFSVLALAILFSIGANAQTAVWGVGAASGSADAEFQNAFTQSTTPTYSNTAWTAVTISESNGATTPGNAYWTRTITGNSQGGYIGTQPPIMSPTVTNGVAIFDSDYMDNGGTAGAFGTGTSPAPHVGELVSPVMDLTGYADSALTVKFYCKWRAFQVNNFGVSLSTDNGVTWTDVDINTLLPAATNTVNEGWVNAPFYTATAGVPNLSQCRIKFTFDGEYYYAMVDDITVQTALEYDIAIGLPNPAGTTLGDAFHYAKVGNNRYIPQNLIDFSNLREWIWGLKIVNNGAVDIFPADGPRARMTIDFTDAVTGVTTPNVYIDTMDITDTLAAGATSDAVPTEQLRNLNFINTNGEGTYTVRYWVEFNGTEVVTDNDTIVHAFTTTSSSAPYVNYLSKCRLRNDGKVNYTRPIFPGGTTFSEFEYGTMFFFPRGATDSIKIDSVDFRYYVASGYTGATSQTVAVNIYQWQDAGTPDGTLDAAGAELTQLGIGVATLNGLGTTTPAGDYGLHTVTNFLDASTGGQMAPFVDNGFYLFTLYENPSVLSGGGTFNSNDGVWFGADEYNYAINAALTTGAEPMPIPSPVKVLDGAGSGDWNWVGFGADLTPSIGVHLDITTFISTSTVHKQEGADLTVYPNPTNNQLNVDVSFEDAQDVMYVITDVSGRVITMTQQNNVTEATQTLDVSGLPAGVYFITAKTAQGESTERFIKK